MVFCNGWLLPRFISVVRRMGRRNVKSNIAGARRPPEPERYALIKEAEGTRDDYGRGARQGAVKTESNLARNAGVAGHLFVDRASVRNKSAGLDERKHICRPQNGSLHNHNCSPSYHQIYQETYLVRERPT